MEAFSFAIAENAFQLRSQSRASLRRTHGDGAVLAARGGRVKKHYASVVPLLAALLERHFEQSHTIREGKP
jgi:hypothetical protein